MWDLHLYMFISVLILDLTVDPVSSFGVLSQLPAQFGHPGRR